MQRHLDWEGCFNARDLGGLTTVEGHYRTRRAAVVRADKLDHLSAAGWSAVRAHGIRTILDLRNDDEVDQAQSPPGLERIRVPLDGVEEDPEFWDFWRKNGDGTPLYFQPHLERFPQRAAQALTAIARARPGGVLFHCGLGRDRTGLLTMVLLALVGVRPDEIAADYALTAERIPAWFAREGVPDHAEYLAELLRRRGRTASEVIHDTLQGFDFAAHLKLDPADVARLRARVLEPVAMPAGHK